MSSSELATIQNYAVLFSKILKRKLEERNQGNFTVFAKFPGGACNAASRLFYFVLKEVQVDAKYVRGIGKGRFVGRDHFWNVFDDGNGVIDPTCEQFSKCECGLSCPYVSSDSAWHRNNWDIDPEFVIDEQQRSDGENELGLCVDIVREIKNESTRHGLS